MGVADGPRCRDVSLPVLVCVWRGPGMEASTNLLDRSVGAVFARDAPLGRGASCRSRRMERTYPPNISRSQRSPPQVRPSCDSPSILYQRGSRAVSSGGPASGSVSPYSKVR